jgi:hypothetical protein
VFGYRERDKTMGLEELNSSACPDGTEGHVSRNPAQDNAHGPDTISNMLAMSLKKAIEDGSEGVSAENNSQTRRGNGPAMQGTTGIRVDSFNPLDSLISQILAGQTGFTSHNGFQPSGMAAPGPQHHLENNGDPWQTVARSATVQNPGPVPRPSDTSIPPSYISLSSDANPWQPIQQSGQLSGGEYQQGINPQQGQIISSMQFLLDSMNMYQDAMGRMNRAIGELGHIMPRLGPSMELLVPGLQGCNTISLSQLTTMSKQASPLWWMGKMIDMQELAMLLHMASTSHANMEDKPSTETKERKQGTAARQRQKRVRAWEASKHKGRSCAHCKTDSTPFWRRDQDTDQYLCNACGLYYAKNHEPRPLSLKKNRIIKTQE